MSRAPQSTKSSPAPHDDFLQLCAVATTGGLTAKEQRWLQEHLARCLACREAMAEYGVVAGAAASAAGANCLRLDLDPDPSWSLERAESSFLARLAQRRAEQEEAGEGRVHSPTGHRDASLNSPFLRFPVAAGGDIIWRHVWLQYAAAAILMIAFGVCLYQIGMHRGSQAASTSASAPQPQAAALEQRLSDAGHDRALLRAETVERGKMISALRQQLSAQATAIRQLKDAATRQQASLRQTATGHDQLAHERSQLAQQLADAQARADELQEQLDTLTRQTAQDATHMAGLEAKIDQLTEALGERQDTIEQQQELLAHDRDIRELIGARDLYIAEVYDVARSGATQKPYGRVFYTKGRSLVFYAYDLDQQSGMKNTKATFQAWGRRGSDRQQALNLGIFYEDNVAKKRWILRFNDPKALEQIDAVFVTIEPSGGSRRPSTKPLLFAYLRLDPNHP